MTLKIVDTNLPTKETKMTDTNKTLKDLKSKILEKTKIENEIIALLHDLVLKDVETFTFFWELDEYRDRRERSYIGLAPIYDKSFYYDTEICIEKNRNENFLVEFYSEETEEEISFTIVKEDLFKTIEELKEELNKLKEEEKLMLEKKSLSKKKSAELNLKILIKENPELAKSILESISE